MVLCHTTQLELIGLCCIVTSAHMTLHLLALLSFFFTILDQPLCSGWCKNSISCLLHLSSSRGFAEIKALAPCDGF